MVDPYGPQISNALLRCNRSPRWTVKKKEFFCVSTLLPRMRRHCFTAFIWPSAEAYKMNNTLTTRWKLVSIGNSKFPVQPTSKPLDSGRKTAAPRGDPQFWRSSKLNTQRPADLGLLAVRQLRQPQSYCAALSCCKWHPDFVEILEQGCLKSTHLAPAQILFDMPVWAEAH